MSSAPPGSRSVLEPCASSPTVSIDPHIRRLGVHTTAGFTSHQVAGRASAALPLLGSCPTDAAHRALDWSGVSASSQNRVPEGRP